MTEQEKRQLVEAVITQLKNEGTDVSSASVVEDVNGVSYVLCYDTNGNIVRVSPDTINQQESTNKTAIEALGKKVDDNGTDIANETKRAQDAEQTLGMELQNGLNQEATARGNLAKEIKSNAMQYDTLGVYVRADKAEIYGRSIDATPLVVEFPAATTEKAGVMSAEDKNALENVNSVINIGEYPNIQAVWDACKQIALNNPEISIIKYSVKAGVTYNSGVVFQSYHYNDAVVTQYYLYGGGHKHECNVRHIVSDGTTDEWQPIQIFTSYKFENGTLYGYKYGESESEQNKVAIVSIPIGSAVAELIQEVTYSELVALRDNAGLVAGIKYRITDYATMTAQVDTSSAGHAFDVIVEALDKDVLSEDAKAVWHDGDDYFAECDLTAWTLKYCLDNDTSRFAWADAENGKGVIYYMKDERDNECPYDFKNIMFKDYFTFSYMVDGVIYDGTVRSEVKLCYGNIIKHRWIGDRQHLNDIVFKNTSFGNNCYFNTFGNNCYSNTFGNNCYSNTFGNDCYFNTFGNNCRNNTFGNNCYSNTFGNNCYSNTFGNNCYSNTFGNNCYSNTFGNDCYFNTFGNNCYSNTFGNNCYSNTFGNDCYNRRIDLSKLSITLNDEYYDDGTNALVPIKHPDLSTQPSILPYKFMGQYVYEQLIPIEFKAGAWVIPKDAKTTIHLFDMSILEVSILCKYEGKLIPLSTREISYNTEEGVYLRTDMMINGTMIAYDYNAYAHIVYTSMSEEDGYYYNSATQKGILVEVSSGITLTPLGMYNGTTFLEPIEQDQGYYFDIPNDYISSGVSIGTNSQSESIIVYFSIPDIGKSGNLEYDNSTKQINLPDELVDKAKQYLVIITIG